LKLIWKHKPWTAPSWLPITLSAVSFAAIAVWLTTHVSFAWLASHTAVAGIVVAPIWWKQRLLRSSATRLADCAEALAAGRSCEIDSNRPKELDRLAVALDGMAAYQALLSEHAERMSQGNLLQDVMPRSQEDRFGSSLSELVKKLRLMVGALETNCLTVSASAREVADVVTAAMRAVSALSEWMTALCSTARSASGHNQSLAQGVDDQSIALRAAMEAMSTLEGQILAVSEGAREQAELAAGVGDKMLAASEMVESAGEAALLLAKHAGTASTTAEQGSASVTDALRLLQSVRESVSDGATRVDDLVKASGAVREVVLSIEQIARQTNLLSLNAAIEAARAGEHGHGFSVVAQEIRRLADSTAGLTGQISALLQSISEAGQEAVAAMEAGQSDVEAVAAAGERAGGALEAILETVQNTAEYAGTVSEGVTSMSGAVKSAQDSVERMLDLARANGDAAEKMARAVDLFTTQLDQVRTAAERIDERARAACSITDEVAQSAETLAGALQQQSQRLSEADDLTDALTASTEESEQLLGRFNFEWDRRKGESQDEAENVKRRHARTMTIQQAALKAWADPEPVPETQDEQRAA
jgi:methyl-accepting chemotaxis protein